MLEFVRVAVQSTAARILLGLLVLSFAIWGMGDVGSGFSTRVATVGDEAIEAETFGRVLQRETRNYGIDPSQIRESGLDQFVLARMVREAVFNEATRALGVSAPDEAVAREVRGQAAFRAGGEFDPVTYQNAVRQMWPSVSAYEETVRASIATSVLLGGVAEGTAAPVGAAESLVSFSEERRTANSILLTPSMVEPPAEPGDADLRAHLDANAARFRIPERRDVTWLALDAEALGDIVQVAEEELRTRYEAESARFSSPERREVGQIVYADEAEAAAAAARVANGEASYDDLLAERGLSRADAALGLLRSGDLGDARDAAVFEAAQTGVVGPIRIPTGFALLEIARIEPGATIGFEDAQEILRAEMTAERAAPEADRLAEEVEDLRAGGATLEEVAEELNVPLSRALGLSRDGVLEDGSLAPGRAATPEFLAEVFDAFVDEERDMARGGDGFYFAVRVDAIAPPREPTLDEVRDRVVVDWLAEQRVGALSAQAARVAERLEQGEELADLAAEFGVEIVQIGPIRRADAEPRLDEAARTALFGGGIGAIATSVTPAFATIAVLSSVERPAELAQMTVQVEQALAQSYAEDQLEFLGRAFEREIGATVNPTVLDSIISQIGGS